MPLMIGKGIGIPQNKDQMHGVKDQLEGEGSLAFKDGAVGFSSGSHPREGSDAEIGDVDKMVSEEGDEAKSSF